MSSGCSAIGKPRPAAALKEAPAAADVSASCRPIRARRTSASRLDAVPYSHPDYFQIRGAVGVLSDGMSSRLFTEVREKRGLVYTVYAMCHSLRDRGAILVLCRHDGRASPGDARRDAGRAEAAFTTASPPTRSTASKAASSGR